MLDRCSLRELCRFPTDCVEIRLLSTLVWLRQSPLTQSAFHQVTRSLPLHRQMPDDCVPGRPAVFVHLLRPRPTLAQYCYGY